MSRTTHINCACGQTRLELQGNPILVSECLCNSCRAAADRLATLPGAKNTLTPYHATPTAEYRKDRVRILSGTENLKEFRLSPTAGSRRVVATCCNTPVFLEMKGAHWISLYLHLWPEETKPRAELRTMTGDLADRSGLPADIPNLKTHTVAFYAKLLAAWIAMGFRVPKIAIEGKIDV
jgi:hypothetical protein